MRTQVDGAVARLPPGHRRRRLARPARWTRSTGPTTSSRRSRGRATACPSGCRSIGPELGCTNIVPVDFVAAAMDHIAHQPGLDGQAFHLTDPKSQRFGEVHEQVRRSAAHAPQLAMRIDKRLIRRAAQGRRCRWLMKLPGAQGRAPGGPAPTSASPTRSLELHRADRAVRHPRHRARARGLRHRGARRSRPTPTSCGTTGSATSTPTCSRTARSRAPSTARRVVITGASSGIGRAAALKIAAAGGIPILVARSAGQARGDQDGDRGRAAARRTSTRPTSPTWTRSTRSSSEMLADHARGRHARQQRRAARSAARSSSAYDRFHDFERTMQLNYFGAIKLIIGAAAAHARAASAATSSTSPRSACRPTRRASRAYVASKAALDAFTRVRGVARSSATASPSRRSTCRSCARR